MSLFITFEGIDGTGKSTQIRLLHKHLSELGHDVVVTREPGGTGLAEAIRHLLLHSSSPVTPRAELLLFAAARAQHVEELIRPSLEAGKTILCDRFADSSVAYQGAGLQIPTEQVLDLNRFATGGLQPHQTFLLDLDTEAAHRRRSRPKSTSEDTIEQRGSAFLQKVREGFMQLAAAEPQRVCVIDASPPAATVHQRILQVLHHRGLLQSEGSLL